MARFKTVSVETGTVEVEAGGTKSVVLESEFLSTPSIYVSPGSTESDTIDPGSATKASWNSNAYVTAVSNLAGAWTFTINVEDTEGVSGDAYSNIKLVYRAVGPVSAV